MKNSWLKLCIIFFCFLFFLISLSLGYAALNQTLGISAFGLVEGTYYFPHTIYCWDDIPFLNYNINSTISRLNEFEIVDLYYSFNRTDLIEEKQKTNSMVSKLSQNSIDVYYLTGDPGWYSKPNSIKNYIDIIYEYNNSSNSNELIKGMLLDIEPYSDSTFKENPVVGFTTFANTMEEVYTYAHNHDLDIIICIPYWYDTKYVTNTIDYTPEENALFLSNFRKLFLNSDRISVMNYYKSASVSHIETEMSLAQELNKEIESVSEFQRPTGDLNENTTFWSDSNPFSYAASLWREISRTYSYEKKYYSYHDLENVLELLGDYEYYQFEYYDEDGEIVTPTNRCTYFPNGEISISKAKKSKAYPKNINYNYCFDDYDIVSFNTTTQNDTKLVSFVLKSVEIYEVEIYPKVYTNEEMTEYYTLTSGNIEFYDSIFKVTRNGSIRSGGYAYVNKIRAGFVYRVTITDGDGTIFEIDRITSSGDNASNVILTDQDKKMTIPVGFKSSLYIGATAHLIDIIPPKEYRVKVYPKYYDFDEEMYKPITSGVVYVQNVDNLEEFNGTINEDNGEYYTYIYNIISDEEYIISIEGYDVVEVEGLDDSNSPTTLSSNATFSVPYELVSSEDVTINLYMNQIVGKEIYEVDIYLRDADNNQYKIDDSYVSLKNLETGHVVTKIVVDDGAGSYIYPFGYVLTETRYEVTLTCEREFIITDIQVKGDSGYFSILTATPNVFKIPNNTKQNKRVNMKLFLEEIIE